MTKKSSGTKQIRIGRVDEVKDFLCRLYERTQEHPETGSEFFDGHRQGYLLGLQHALEEIEKIYN